MVLPLTLLGMSLFVAAHGLGGSKNTFIYSAVRNFGTVIPYLKKIQKCMNHATNPFSSVGISIFLPGISNVAISRNIDIDCILIHNF